MGRSASVRAEMGTKRLFLPSLRRLDAEIGFSIPRPPITSGPVELRVEVFREGMTISEKLLCFTGGSSADLASDQGEWQPDGGLLDKDLVTVEFNYAPGSAEWLAHEKQELEGAMEVRVPALGQRAGILFGMVPVKKAGSPCAPIYHLGHYMLNSPEHESYMCFMNYSAGGTTQIDAKNGLEFRLISPGGELLGTCRRENRHNSSLLISVRELCEECGVGAPSGHVTVLARGGSSQFAILTLFRNRQTGALGLEHSLPPVYYTEAVMNPASRTEFYKRTAAAGPPVRA
jgi:hypothetical protein